MIEMMGIGRLLASGVVLAQLGAGSATAAEQVAQDASHPFFRHRLLLQGGAAFNTIDSFAAVGTASGRIGTRLSFEDHLGFDSSKATFDVLLRYRLSDRWMIEGAYFGAPRNSAASMSRTIEFGKYSFNAGAALNADLGIGSYRFALGYAFHKSHDLEVGAALTTYVSDFSAALRGNAWIGNLSTGFQTERYHAPAPVPAIGLYAHYALSPRWLISGRADFMDLNISRFAMFGIDLRDVDGRVVSLEASTEYRLFDNLGLGVGYRYMDVALGATTSGLRGSVGYAISAPTVFARASF